MTAQAWFLAPPAGWSEDEVVLDEDETHHLRDVLRLRSGDVVTISDGDGTVARCSLHDVAGARVRATVLERSHQPRPRPEIALLQAAPKGSKLDGIVTRAAELGITDLSVFESIRTVARWDGHKRERMTRRWSEIAAAAAKQSRNPYLMRTGPVLTWKQLLARVTEEPCAVTLWEDASAPLRTVLPEGAARVALVVGPEGGLAPEEVHSLEEAGAAPVSLGPRILRTEMASLVAISALMWHYGLLG